MTCVSEGPVTFAYPTLCVGYEAKRNVESISQLYFYSTRRLNWLFAHIIQIIF